MTNSYLNVNVCLIHCDFEWVTHLFNILSLIHELSVSSVFSSQFRHLICIFKHLNTNTSQVYSAVNQASRILSVKTSLPLTYRENEKKACYESNKLHHCPEEVINLNKKGNKWISRCPLSILTYLADLMLSWVLARSLAAATAQTLSPIRLNLDL